MARTASKSPATSAPRRARSKTPVRSPASRAQQESDSTKLRASSATGTHELADSPTHSTSVTKRHVAKSEEVTAVPPRGGAPLPSAAQEQLQDDGAGHLMPITHVPKHLAFNVHVKHGYRRHGLTVREAIFSLWGYLHNETANIYTHLLGALICAYWICFVEYPVSEPHYAVIALADATSMVCFMGSVIYHTLMNSTPSEREYRQLLYFDMAGIWIVNTGAGIAATQLLLPCAPLWLKGLLAVGPSLGSAFWIVFLAKSPASRAAAFGVQLLLRIGLIVTTAALSLTHWTPTWLATHLFIETWPLIGAVINILRIPERWYPGRFDWFQSHTIMHICVAIGMLAQHFIGLHRAGIIDGHDESLACINEHHDELMQLLGGK